MKKILIVDDTPANLEAAKAYFSQNVDFEFLYATDRKSAEELILTCDALITDAQMPFDDKSETAYQISKEKILTQTPERINEFHLDNVMASNGKLLALEAIIRNKPCVVISHHGTALTVNKIPVMEKDQIEKILKEATGGMGISNVERFAGKDLNYYDDKCIEAGFPLVGEYGSVYSLSLSGVAQLSTDKELREDLSKKDSSGWELAFTKLSEEFKLNEKPNEIPGIKLQ